MFGWRGQLLRVNLASGAITKEPLDQSTVRNYLGGRGLGVYLHINEVFDSTAPLDAANHLIFTTGPLTGTLAPNGGRYTIITKIPPTGEIASASISGNWGAELKFAGYDAIIFEGKATKPVYLWINNGNVELRSAIHISGRLVGETTDTLLAETDERAAVSCIGPAGENEIDCSLVVSDYISAAGGYGAGAVMGSKNLKAVVVRGTEGFRIADRQRFLAIATELRSRMAPITAKGVFLHKSVLVADSVAWDSTPGDFKPARTHRCFGCATSFSSFAFDKAVDPLMLSGENLSGKNDERLKEYKLFTDLGLDFVAAKALFASLGNEAEERHAELARKFARGDRLEQHRHANEPESKGTNNGASIMERGPCIAGGYAVVPRLPADDDADDSASTLTAILDSVGLCTFLAAGIGIGTITELLTAATGVVFSQFEIIQAGQRISRSILLAD